MAERHQQTKNGGHADKHRQADRQTKRRLSTHLIGYLLHSLDTGAIEIVLVPSGLDEQVGLDVPLHLLHAGHKVVVPPVHLPLTRLTSCVCT